MKKLYLLIALVFSGILMQAQMKKATEIHILTEEKDKTVCLNKYIDYLIEDGLMFFDIDEKRGIARSEDFQQIGPMNWKMKSSVNLKVSNAEDGTMITITGQGQVVHNNADMIMLNKNPGWYMGGLIFEYMDKLAKNYPDKTSITYSK